MKKIFILIISLMPIQIMAQAEIKPLDVVAPLKIDGLAEFYTAHYGNTDSETGQMKFYYMHRDSKHSKRNVQLKDHFVLHIIFGNRHVYLIQHARLETPIYTTVLSDAIDFTQKNLPANLTEDETLKGLLAPLFEMFKQRATESILKDELTRRLTAFQDYKTAKNHVASLNFTEVDSSELAQNATTSSDYITRYPTGSMFKPVLVRYVKDSKRAQWLSSVVIENGYVITITSANFLNYAQKTRVHIQKVKSTITNIYYLTEAYAIEQDTVMHGVALQQGYKQTVPIFKSITNIALKKSLEKVLIAARHYALNGDSTTMLEAISDALKNH